MKKNYDFKKLEMEEITSIFDLGKGKAIINGYDKDKLYFIDCDCECDEMEGSYNLKGLSYFVLDYEEGTNLVETMTDEYPNLINNYWTFKY